MTPDAVAAELNAALNGGELGDARFLLHPYVRWVDEGGTPSAGRTKLLARLADTDAQLAPPFELRDGQLYRCTVCVSTS